MTRDARKNALVLWAHSWLLRGEVPMAIAALEEYSLGSEIRGDGKAAYDLLREMVKERAACYSAR